MSSFLVMPLFLSDNENIKSSFEKNIYNFKMLKGINLLYSLNIS